MVSGTHTPCGRAPAPTTNSARTCASTSQVPWPRSPIPAAASCAPKPAPSWPPPPHRLPPARSPSPSCGPCSARPGAAAHRHRSRPAACEQAMGRQALALLRHLDAACASAADLEHAAAESFNQHPDAEIITSFPGLGPLTGPGTRRDRRRPIPLRRHQRAQGLDRSPPITRASGKTMAACTAVSRTSASPPSATTGPSRPSPPHPAPEPTTTGASKTATGTPPPSATSSDGSSAGLHHCVLTGQHDDETTAFPATSQKEKTRSVAA